MMNINIEALVAVLVGVHVLALAVVNLTPTPKDNEALSKAYKWLEVVAGVITQTAKETGDDSN